ncbi:hypothetical protein M9Y10_006043 [Tritrichomonas musculus]|uniref:LRAT domain-containing protein n=1 Tax=Tritrichomonas musculus TaxID=1915356 RepID=A0ABR2JEA3_9EUKA
MRTGSKGIKYMLKCNVGPDERTSKVISSVAVRRPLAIPGACQVYGQVLSHSGCVVKTTTGFYLVEYMSDNFVHCNRCSKYKEQNDFIFQGYLWIHDDANSSTTNKDITLETFCLAMINIMKEKPYDTFTHNCFQARYLTMKKFGMESSDPLNFKRCIFFQGWHDLYEKEFQKKNKVKRVHI